MRHELDAREYKLLLTPERFSNSSAATVAAFWNDKLCPLIDDQLGSRNDGEARHHGWFGAPVERTIRFWDTRDGLFTRLDLALRERVTVLGSQPTGLPEITVKLRMPDLFVVAATELPGSNADARTTFEEDIAPLEVDNPTPGGRCVVIASKRSIRSRFSLSTTQTARWKANPTVRDLARLLPTLSELVTTSGTIYEPGAPLESGVAIRELVFKGATVKLGSGVIGKFALTLWYFDDQTQSPSVAEISFKCRTPGGEMAGRAARRSLTLFTSMQSDLSDWVNSEYSSKTALALPSASGNATDLPTRQTGSARSR